MRRTNTLLAVVAGVQSLLVSLLWWPRDAEALASTPLIGLESEAVTRLEVQAAPKEGEEPESVILERSGDTWAITSAGGYPADPDKVAKVLDALLGAKTRDPVGTTAASHTALKVADDAYDKKIVLSSEGGDRVLYVGAGSGRAANLRLDDSDTVYPAPGVSQWSLGQRPRDYYDPLYLELKSDALTSFSVEGPQGELSLERKDGTWTSPALPEGASLDQAAVEKLLKPLASLRISELPEAPKAPPSGELKLGWTVDDEGESLPGGLTVGSDQDGKRPVRGSDRAFTVLVTASRLDPLGEASLEGLLAEAPADAP